MTSKPVSALLSDLGITRSHSRPRVSNDNPFSEAQFKTLKYVHDFGHHFNSLAQARAFCDGFFAEYNHVHHHSAIGWHTPASVHHGTYGAIDDARAVTLDRAWRQHPERFGQRHQPSDVSLDLKNSCPDAVRLGIYCAVTSEGQASGTELRVSAARLSDIYDATRPIPCPPSNQRRRTRTVLPPVPR